MSSLRNRRGAVSVAVGAGLVAATLSGILAGPASARTSTANYSSAPAVVTTSSYTFGQAPVFMPDGRVVFGKDFGAGAGTQVYVANQNGSALRCLTCELKAPNNVPAVRPQGDWILFHSWMGHQITLGSPGYGGLGSALWIMRPDGSDVTQLTDAVAAGPSTEGYDDYHGYWSPDGRQIVWTHLNWNFVDGRGQGKWDVEVADFVATPRPHLNSVRVVRPADGHWYETQWWAPDGSGFLYTETSGTAMDTELFFCRLTPKGCATEELTNSPSWNEQALFTPDGRDVIFMSSRDHPGFCNTFISASRVLGVPADVDYLLTLPIFEACYEQPAAPEATDLYLLDLSTRNVRRLTTDGNAGWIIPEFAWDPHHRFLIYTEARLYPGARVSLPLDVSSQLASEVALLEHPPHLRLRPSNLLEASLPIEYRTRILRFSGLG